MSEYATGPRGDVGSQVPSGVPQTISGQRPPAEFTLTTPPQARGAPRKKGEGGRGEKRIEGDQPRTHEYTNAYSSRRAGHPRAKKGGKGGKGRNARCDRKAHTIHKPTAHQSKSNTKTDAHIAGTALFYHKGP